MSKSPLGLGILISGGGTTMLNIAGCIRQGALDARIVMVISSNPGAGGVQRAAELDLPVQVVPRKQYDSIDTFSAEVFGQLRSANAELVVLAGFLTLVKIPDDFRGRVMNVHPALLPKYGGKGMYGHHVHEAVIAAGERESGCTVHFADNQYDHGPIILQRRCPVMPDDTPETLAQRVMAEERKAYPQAIQLFAEGRLKIEGDKVRIIDAVGR